MATHADGSLETLKKEVEKSMKEEQQEKKEGEREEEGEEKQGRWNVTGSVYSRYTTVQL